eukprot:m.40148 g.40148  ORF g.40148 m.40148 type:complete len:91 (-) comp10405_c1_seq1:6317-6589(-)
MVICTARLIDQNEGTRYAQYACLHQSTSASRCVARMCATVTQSFHHTDESQIMCAASSSNEGDDWPIATSLAIERCLSCVCEAVTVDATP